MTTTCPSVMFCVMILCLTLCKSLTSSPACKLKFGKILEDYKYFKNGDIILGGILTLSLNMNELLHRKEEKTMLCSGSYLSNYRNFLDFRFAIEKINKDPNILPNVTLGYHIYNSCNHAKKAVKSVLQILSGPGRTVPNYFCSGQGKIAGFIGDFVSETTMPIAQLLNVYGYSQISYGATDPMLTDRYSYPYLFSASHNDHIYFSAVLKLLKHFSWNWVGIVFSANDSGYRESSILSSLLNSQGICVEFTAKMADQHTAFDLINIDIQEFKNTKIQDIILKSSASVIIVCGTISFCMAELLQLPDKVGISKTFIFPPAWFDNNEIRGYYVKVFNCSLGFVHFLDTGKLYNSSRPHIINQYHTEEIERFLDDIHPFNYPNDKLLAHIWMTYHQCLSQNTLKNKFFELINKLKLHKCSGKESLKNVLLMTDYPVVYNTVLIMSYALDAQLLFTRRQRSENTETKSEYRNKLHQYLRSIQYDNGTEKILYFDERGELNTKFLIYNWMKVSNNNRWDPVGTFIPWALPDNNLLINSSWITWKTDTKEVPRSQCSENCPPGSRKIKNNMKPICCYDCVLCSKGEISNLSDSEKCIKCPDIEWPNDKKDQCIPKSEEFLDYSDALAIVLSSVSILFWIISLLILGIFVLYQDTPIVKANNKNLSFILLVSISMCFLCSFLFIGCPTDRTCMFRQIVFGIIFSIAVYSVLAKTIMVCIVFKASRPGSPWQKLIECKLSNYIVLMASSVEIIISIIWLSVSPPFVALDTHSYQGKIVIQCNEGSTLGFYAVLFYLGFLVVISFMVAYLGRTLPDRFNEGKFITFSMLVFCSVWITMIPAYLSTKGKNMVAVEIFSIVTSGAGLLGCIFFPKCYIILLKPEMNRKRPICHYLKK